MSREEKWILVAFAVLIGLWVFRADIDLPHSKISGWGSLLPTGKFCDDSTVAILLSLLLFCIPAKSSKRPFILEPQSLNRIPWDVILLFGGGFALAQGMESTGLSSAIGDTLSFLQKVPLPFILLTITLSVTFLSEVASNVATVQMVMPIISALAQKQGWDPKIVLMTAGIASSMGFMLPVATAANALFFSSKRYTVMEIAKVGLVLNLVADVSIALVMWLKSL